MVAPPSLFWVRDAPSGPGIVNAGLSIGLAVGLSAAFGGWPRSSAPWPDNRPALQLATGASAMICLGISSVLSVMWRAAPGDPSAGAVNVYGAAALAGSASLLLLSAYAETLGRRRSVGQSSESGESDAE